MRTVCKHHHAHKSQDFDRVLVSTEYVLASFGRPTALVGLCFIAARASASARCAAATTTAGFT